MYVFFVENIVLILILMIIIYESLKVNIFSMNKLVHVRSRMREWKTKYIYHIIIICYFGDLKEYQRNSISVSGSWCQNRSVRVFGSFIDYECK